MHRTPAIAIGVALVLGAPAAGAHPMFMGLGDLPGGEFYSDAFSVSADGSTVVGSSRSAAGDEAFRWTLAGGVVGLGDLPGGNHASFAYGVSADGSVVVGEGAPTEGYEAFRWTQSGGMVGLGDLPGGAGTPASTAWNVSGDGSVVVGQGAASAGGIAEAFRWTETGGMVGLGFLSGGGQWSEARGISLDASVVVGGSDSSDFFLCCEAFRWTQEEGMLGLGSLGGLLASALDVSADGSLVVGYSEPRVGPGPFGPFEAFLWSAADGMVGLGDLPGGGFESAAGAVSADGSLVVGAGSGASGSEAFVWDAAHGMRRLEDVLAGVGVDLTGWTLRDATDVSGDGRTIVGWGENPDGNHEAWIAVIPEPGTVVLVALGIGGLAAFRRRGREAVTSA